MKDSRKRLLLMALKNKRQLNANGKLVIDNQIDFMLYKQEQSAEKEERSLG